MSIPKGFKAIDWGGEIDQVVTSQSKKIFKPVRIHWSEPTAWLRDEYAPIAKGVERKDCLYCLLRDHHKARQRKQIVYVGITNNLDRRFHNHAVAAQLREKKGTTLLSVGEVDFGSFWRQAGSKKATEQLEHLLIWAIWPKFNDRKSDTLPGMGSSATKPWHVVNSGHRFQGQMPREIVYPWMLTLPGKLRSAGR